MDALQKFEQTIRNVPDFPKPGIQFKDITPVLSDWLLCDRLTKLLSDQWWHYPVDAVVGIESRGFIFGMQLAQALRVPFVPVRKAGKLPYKTYQATYDLEYGSATLEIHTDAIKPGKSVLIHDDLLATGGTAKAAAGLVEMCGGVVSGYSFLIELGFLNGREALKGPSIQTLLTF